MSDPKKEDAAIRQVAIFGLGALGSHFAYCARELPIKMQLVDGDKVEAKNVASQFHTTMGRGRNKAHALAQTMLGFFRLQMWPISQMLREDNAEALLWGASVAVDCMDNAPSRRLLREAAKGMGIPVLHGGLAEGGAYGVVAWDESFRIDEMGAPADAVATCEGGEFLPFICVVSSFMAMALQAWIDGGTKVGFRVHPGGAMSLA